MNVIPTNTAELIDIEKISNSKTEKDIFSAEELEILWQHLHPLIKNILSGFVDKAKARAENLPEDVPHLLITNKVSKKYDYRNFTERIFLLTLIELHIIPEYRKGKLDENGMKIEERQKPRLTPHCTRHTFASLMDSAGMDKEILARIMGHTDYKTTSDYYIHKQSEELVQEMMDAAKK